MHIWSYPVPLDLIDHVTPQIAQVFNSPEQVTAKLIQSCYDTELQVCYLNNQPDEKYRLFQEFIWIYFDRDRRAEEGCISHSARWVRKSKSRGLQIWEFCPT